MRAVQLSRHGGPEALELVDLPTPQPGPGEALVRHEAVGLNFIEVYQRSGLYPLELPTVLGQEAAGVVQAVGPDVFHVKQGDRVAFVGRGGYAQASVQPADRLVTLPEGIDTRTAAAVMLKGMTAEFLVRRCFRLQAGQAALVHAAAGGVGSLLVQWAKAVGATVIGTAGSSDKAQRARALGCDHVVLYREEAVAQRVRELTGGRGVDVAYDSVGAATFDDSLKSLARRGTLVSFGNASGAVPAVEPLALARGGSLFLTRPTLFDYIGTREELEESAGALFERILSGDLRVEIGAEFPLERVADAHRALEARETVGSTILTP